jgi:hypothetical protein
MTIPFWLWAVIWLAMGWCLKPLWDWLMGVKEFSRDRAMRELIRQVVEADRQRDSAIEKYEAVVERYAELAAEHQELYKTSQEWKRLASTSPSHRDPKGQAPESPANPATPATPRGAPS